MTEHLPECIFKPENIDSAKGIRWGGRPCICDELRACEQRVREEERIRAAGIVMDTREAWRDPDMAWTLIERIKAKP